MFPYVRVFSQRMWRPLTGKKFKYTSSLPGFMFSCALCFLNEPFIPAVTQYFYHLSQLNLFSLPQLKKICIHRLFMESSPFSIFCDTICRNHFRYWDHLRSNLGIICGTGIICGPVQYRIMRQNDIPAKKVITCNSQAIRKHVDLEHKLAEYFPATF